MKKWGIFMITMVVGLSLSGIVWAQDDIQKHPACKYCGMDRAKFAHSRVFIQHDDGTTEGTCSIHCAAVDLAVNIDKTPKAIMVGDFNTKNLIDVEKAFWVVGGSKMGVMTKRAKWAFAKQEDADRFVKENGGVMSTFEEAMKGAYEDMYADTKMIREKRKMAKMGHHHN
jgi:copper chaperone NosL